MPNGFYSHLARQSAADKSRDHLNAEREGEAAVKKQENVEQEPAPQDQEAANMMSKFSE